MKRISYHLLILSALGILPGCLVTSITGEVYFSDKNQLAEIAGEEMRKCTLTLKDSKGDTTFRIGTLKGYLFTFSMWTSRDLQFVLPSEDIVTGMEFTFPEIDGWSLAGFYVKGLGKIKKGKIRVISVSRKTNSIRLHLDIPGLRPKFQGSHTFQLAIPKEGRRSSVASILCGFIKSEPPPEETDEVTE